MANALKQKIDFTTEQMERINWEAGANRRAFKNEVAQLIDEALAKRTLLRMTAAQSQR